MSNKRIFALLGLSALILSLALSCEKESIQREDATTPKNETAQDIAVKAVTDLWNDLYGAEQTKSAQQIGICLSSIQTVKVPAVKAETMYTDSAFVINFSGDNGFAVVSMRGEEPNVLALTDQGSIDSQKLFCSNATFESESEEKIHSFIESALYNDAVSISDSEEEEAPSLSPQTRSNHSPTIDAPWSNNNEKIHVWYKDECVRPIVHLKWNQTYPFNLYMPQCNSEEMDNEYYYCRNAVGCTIIAAAQIMVSTLHPSTIKTDDETHILSDYQNLCTYENKTYFHPINYEFSNNLDQDTKLKTQALARLLRYLADSFDAIFYPSGSTGASSSKAMRFMAKADEDRYGDYHYIHSESGINATSSLYNMLRRHKPILMRGEPQSGESGHAWVMDGYVKYHKTNEDDIRFSRTYYHFNWGWGGHYDGYYASCIVSAQKDRDTIYDIDNSSARSVSSNNNYNYDVYYYLY